MRVLADARAGVPTHRPGLIMLRRLLHLVIAAFALAAGSARAAELTPYNLGDWARIQQANAGKPYVVHFWGMTCGPCVDELPQWSDYLKRHSDLHVVFVEVDEVPAPVVTRVMHDAGLDRADQRALSVSFDEYVRHEIDPRWMGELPATMLVDRAGHAQRIMGAMDFGQLQAWESKASVR